MVPILDRRQFEHCRTACEQESSGVTEPTQESTGKAASPVVFRVVSVTPLDSCPQAVLHCSNGLLSKMDTILRDKLALRSESALSGCHDGHRCRANRTPPWIRAQHSSLIMWSVLCAFPCPQAWKSQPLFENDLKLQGSGASDRCLGWTNHRFRGPCVYLRYNARPTVLSRAVLCRTLPCTSDVTTCEPLGLSA